MIGSLGQPILFLIALGFGFGPIFAKAGQGNYIQFLAPGIIMIIFMESLFNVGIAVTFVGALLFGISLKIVTSPFVVFTLNYWTKVLLDLKNINVSDIADISDAQIVK